MLLVIDRWKIQRGKTFLLTDRCTPGSDARAGPDATGRYVPVCFVRRRFLGQPGELVRSLAIQIFCD